MNKNYLVTHDFGWKPFNRGEIGRGHLLAPAIIGGALVAGGALGGGLINAFGKKGGSLKQNPMESIEVTRAREMLREFGTSGITPWDYNFTESYKGDLGNYDMSGLETQGQNLLSSTLGSNPLIFSQGTDTLSDFLTTDKYDPTKTGVYEGLTAGIDRNTQEAIDEAKRGGAYTGNLYSTSQMDRFGDIAAQSGIAKSNILSNLYQNYVNQRLSAASGAISAGSTQKQMGLADIAASHQFGGLERALQDQKAKDAYGAWLKQREANLIPLQSLTGVLGSNQNFGFTSIPTPNPWNDLLNTLVKTGGYIYGQKVGAGSVNNSPENTGYGGPGGNDYQWGD
jgi:hypothetical protein